MELCLFSMGLGVPPRAQTGAGQAGVSGIQRNEKEKPWSKRLEPGLVILVPLLILGKSPYCSASVKWRSSAWTLLPQGVT